jgi:hypothetical protein
MVEVYSHYLVRSLCPVSHQINKGKPKCSISGNFTARPGTQGTLIAGNTVVLEEHTLVAGNTGHTCSCSTDMGLMASG